MNLTGRSLKQYQIIGELGAGGMGVVYRARDTVLGRDVAVKLRNSSGDLSSNVIKMW